MNKKFLSVMLLATFFLGSASLFIACSDDDTVYDDTSVTSQISSLTSQLATLQSALTEAQNAASAAQSTADDALANAASAASAAASADDDAAAANNAAIAANQAAEAASALAEAAAATAKAEAIEEAIKQTKELIAASEEATDEQIQQALALLIEGIDSDLNELSSALNGVSEEVKANAADIVALQEQMTAVEKYKEYIESLSKTIASIESDLTAVSNRVDGIEVDLDALTLTVNGVVNDLKGLSSDVTNLTETVTNIQASLLALTGNVDDLSSTLNGLLGDFSNLSGTVSNLSDYVDNLSSTLTGLSGTVSDLSSIVDGKCTMDEVKDYIAQVLSGDTQVVYTKDEVDELLAGISGRISNINDALLILQTYKITSLVFIPELYVRGIEATRFVYASGVAWGENLFAQTAGTTSEGYAYVIPKDTKGDFHKVTKTEDSVWYNLAPTTTKVSYHYNPSSANLGGVTFGFEVRNVEAITRASIPTWSASIDNNATTWSKGILEVYYNITTSGSDDLADGLRDPQNGEVSVMSLKATLANDTTVYSDYAAIVPAKRKIDYIAFTTASKCTADKTNAKYGSCNDEYDLYQSAQDAAECAPSIECIYNGGAINLAEKLCVHYTQADYGDFGTDPGYCEGIMELAELESWGLSLEFAPIEFQVGTNKTDQSAYCFVTEDGEFTPAYIPTGKTTDDKTPIEANSTTGKSSIGRTPLVVVKLVDRNGSVVAFGYVRIKITETATTPTTKLVIWQSEEPAAYDCDTYTVSVPWEKISADLYESTSMSAENFRNHYTTDGYTYIKNAKGEYVQSNDYGSISQSGDSSGDNTTTVLTVTVDADQKFNIVDDNKDNRTDTIYIKYSYGSNVVYVGISITIAKLPSVKFTQKTGIYWEDNEDGELEDNDVTKLNVPFPATSGKTVTDYTKTLNELFSGNEVVATLGGENKDKYKASEVKFTYSFAKTEDQDKIGSYSLYVDADGDSLFANKSLDDGYLVAYFTDSEAGVINYATTDVAKEILNLYAHDYDSLAHAKVKLTATYGDCKRELEDRTFIVDFLRPIDILTGEKAIFEDAAAEGDTVSLANLITIKDWRGKMVYSKEYSTGFSENGVNLYTYYGIQKIEVDLANATINVNTSASDANIQLSLVDGNGNTLNSNTQPITNASALSNIYIKQSNVGAVTNDFTLQIPIKLTYAWGTVKGTIKATVNKTMGS